MGRPETDQIRGLAMNLLGNGLCEAKALADALAVYEAELAMKRRLGVSEESMLNVQGNLACAYDRLGRLDDALSLRREVYSGHLRLHGEEHGETLREAGNLVSSLIDLQRFEEAKALLRETMPVTLRVLGESSDLTLKMRWRYAEALYLDTDATLDDLREAVATLEDAELIARRVFGGSHPNTGGFEDALRQARAVLAAREAPARLGALAL